MKLKVGDNINIHLNCLLFMLNSKPKHGEYYTIIWDLLKMWIPCVGSENSYSIGLGWGLGISIFKKPGLAPLL